MKKLIMTFVLAFAMGVGAFAQEGFFDSEEYIEKGLFGRGEELFEEELRSGQVPLLPGAHGLEGNQDASPLGSGIVVLLGLGAAYAFGKKHED